MGMMGGGMGMMGMVPGAMQQHAVSSPSMGGAASAHSPSYAASVASANSGGAASPQAAAGSSAKKSKSLKAKLGNLFGGPAGTGSKS